MCDERSNFQRLKVQDIESSWKGVRLWLLVEPWIYACSTAFLELGWITKAELSEDALKVIEGVQAKDAKE
jgi:hypothetical protein